ncbi:MAG TPA: hypothetical protein VFV38_08525 [Ktedonobacteraceae bacterium]|nr:hypothetical protein [Ktedonobacteraceae bacterium]
MSQQSNEPEQHRKEAERHSASAHKRTRAEENAPGSGRSIIAHPQLDGEAEKRTARASGKQSQRGQGRITHPKTNQSNQYR